MRILLLTVSLLLPAIFSFAQEVSKEQIKGLDEQVQEIKTDVLAIAAELNQLEEKLLFPSSTQVAVFLSLAPGEKFRLDSVEIQLDGQPVAHHLYTYKELEALQRGGVQRLHTGNLVGGEHDLQVTFIGKSEGGSDLRKTESFKVTKGVGPETVGITLTSQSIAVKEWQGQGETGPGTQNSKLKTDSRASL